MAFAFAPEQIADVIFTAATAGSSQLRYIAGENAKVILGAKANMSEADFASIIQQRFGV